MAVSRDTDGNHVTSIYCSAIGRRSGDVIRIIQMINNNFFVKSLVLFITVILSSFRINTNIEEIMLYQKSSPDCSFSNLPPRKEGETSGYNNYIRKTLTGFK